MALTPAERRIGEAWWLRQPAKRGIDIPADVFDRMRHVADGITVPLWGRRLLPHQMQHLYNHGLTQPFQIHAAIGRLDHPHAPNIKVSEYSDYVTAYQTHQEHSK